MKYKEEIAHILDECVLPQATRDFLEERLVSATTKRLINFTVKGDKQMLLDKSETEVKLLLFNSLITDMFKKECYKYAVDENGVPHVFLQLSRF